MKKSTNQKNDNDNDNKLTNQKNDNDNQKNENKISNTSNIPLDIWMLIFKYLSNKEKTVCTITDQFWRVIINEFWPELKISPDDLLIHGALIGSLFLMRLARKYGATATDRPLMNAANGGHLNCIKLLNRWGITECWGNITYVIMAIAQGGDIDCMKYLKKRGVTDFNVALSVAARHGHLKLLELLQKWGATLNLNEAFRQAANNDHIDCLKFLKECGTNRS